ncbi:uncharacterized protein A4U43_C08F14840 [Asparagus officinalis]|nr:uncharacterized protein A4U43_C08F14840 [Asparagus officinalis]
MLLVCIFLYADVATIRFPGNHLFSTRTIKCLTNIEAFVLQVADFEEVAILFTRFLRNPRVLGAMRRSIWICVKSAKFGFQLSPSFWNFDEGAEILIYYITISIHCHVKILARLFFL